MIGIGVWEYQICNVDLNELDDFDDKLRKKKRNVPLKTVTFAEDVEFEETVMN